MRTAIVLHGNLRTFLMTMREFPCTVCDTLIGSIVNPNNSDIFIVTETNDFYFDGAQHTTKSIEISNCNAFRLSTRIVQTSHQVAAQIIETELRRLLGDRIKGLLIEEPVEDLSADPKFQILNTCNATGSIPALIVKQYRKLKTAEAMISEYERQHGFEYDIVMKSRFDNMYQAGTPLHLNRYDFKRKDIYVPGVRGPVVYDWYAFGTRQVMRDYLNLYDKLGFTLGKKVYEAHCNKCHSSCNLPLYDDETMNCDSCNSSDVSRYEVTIASEYHIWKLFEDGGYRFETAAYPVFIYRYRDTSDTDIPKAELQSASTSGVTILNHSDKSIDAMRAE